MKKVIVFFLILFCSWVSLSPEAIQARFQLFLRILLFLGLIFVIRKYRINYLSHIFKDSFYWFYLWGICLSFIFAQNQMLATTRLYGLVITSFLIYFFFQAFPLKLYRMHLAVAFCCLAILVAFIGFLELLFHKNILYTKFIPNPFYWRYLTRFRMMSTQMHPSVLGTYFMCVLPFSYYLINQKYIWRLRILGYVSSVIVWLALVLTFARSAIIGAFISLGIFLWQKKNRKFFLLVMASIIISLFLLTISTAKFTTLHKNFMWIWTKRTSISYRLERFPTAFKMLREHPFVGVGLENFRFLFDQYHRYPDVSYEFKIPDNMYLTILSETGLIGFIAFLLLISQLLKGARQKLKNLSPEESLFLMIGIVGFSGLLFNMFSYELLYWHMPLYFFWLYASIIRATSSQTLMVANRGDKILRS